MISVLMLLVSMVCLATIPVSAENGYTYTVRIYAGAQGTIDGSDVQVYENLKIGDLITFSPDSVTLKDGSKYYVSGIRKSGADNYDPDNPQRSAITVTGDEDYVVAYGILGDSVGYTVNYVDDQGSKVAESKKYYGNIGDKPMIACEYIEGYYPQALNLTKTLSSNESENVFNFVYTSTADTETVIYTGGGGAAGGGAAGGAGAGGANIGDGTTPTAGPEDVVDLDDNQTPTTDGSGVDGTTDIDDSKTPGANWPLIGGGAALLVAIAAAALILVRRRREAEEE